MKFGVWILFLLTDRQKDIGVKYLLVQQDLFDSTVEGNGMKLKGSKETVRVVSNMI